MAADPDEIVLVSRRRLLRAFLAGRKADRLEACPYEWDAGDRVERSLMGAWIRGWRVSHPRR